MPPQKRRGKPSAQSSKKQASFAELGVLPTIAKPASVVGEAIDQPRQVLTSREDEEEGEAAAMKTE